MGTFDFGGISNEPKSPQFFWWEISRYSEGRVLKDHLKVLLSCLGVIICF